MRLYSKVSGDQPQQQQPEQESHHLQTQSQQPIQGQQQVVAWQKRLGDVHSESKLTSCVHFLHFLPASICFLLRPTFTSCTYFYYFCFNFLLPLFVLLLLPRFQCKLLTDLQQTPVNAKAPMLYYCVGFVNAENVQQADYMGREPQDEQLFSSRKCRLSKVVRGQNCAFQLEVAGNRRALRALTGRHQSPSELKFLKCFRENAM
eukprot:Skav215579  [mRNA]  locus=scaffold2748:161813:162424:- [translate_table: standard]